jgi:hypothetical protein
MKLLLALIAALLPLARSQAQLLVRVSIKQIRHANGSMIERPFLWTGEEDARAAVAEANRYLDLAGHGYRLVLDEYRILDNVADFYTRPSDTPSTVIAIENYARSPGVDYGWRTNAINVYVNWGGGGYCSFPSDPFSAIVIGGGSGGSPGQLLLHEIGHFFWLGHTFDCCGCCDRAQNPTCSHTFNASGPGATGIADDLLPDLVCNYPDEIATNRFGVDRTVVALNPAEFGLFSVTYSNLMSYHPQSFLLSNRQKDMWAISANGPRAYATVGRTRFVSSFGFTWGAGAATSTSLPSVKSGLDAANPGDVVMIHAGAYREALLLNEPIVKPVTFRASRGAATIGRP